jgi:hypothetical protein
MEINSSANIFKLTQPPAAKPDSSAQSQVHHHDKDNGGTVQELGEHKAPSDTGNNVDTLI